MASICTQAQDAGPEATQSRRSSTRQAPGSVPNGTLMAFPQTRIMTPADSYLPELDSGTDSRPSVERHVGELSSFPAFSIAVPESPSRAPVLLAGMTIRSGCTPLMARPRLHVAAELSPSNANRTVGGCRCCLVAPLMVTSKYLTNAKNPASSPLYRELPD